MAQRPSASSVFALPLVFLFAARCLNGQEPVAPVVDLVSSGGGTVVLGPDDTLELILKLPRFGNESRPEMPELRAWLLEPNQAPPGNDQKESGRSLVWPSPTRAGEYIAHLRGLAPPRKDGAPKAWDILLRWSLPGGRELGETRLTQRAAFRTGLPNVVLLLDGSGSMIGSDPDKSRIEATRSFISIGKTSGGIGSIAIVQFATQVRELLPLTPVADDEMFQRALKQVTADGFTDIDGSIRKAVEMLRAPDAQSAGAIVLLTDGVQEPGEYAGAHTLARNAGIPIHTVALGPDADRELLKRIAVETGGTFSAAAKGQELVRLYSAIAAGIVGGRTIVSADFPPNVPRVVSFPVDGACRTLVATAASDASGTLSLTAPHGEIETAGPQVHPVFHKVAPAAGIWQAQWAAGPDARLEASAHTALYPLFFRSSADSNGAVEVDADDPRVALSLTDAASLIGAASVEVALEIPGRARPLTASLFDDGKHDDGNAGDGIYAGSIPMSVSPELALGTSGVITATVVGKRSNGESFRREVRARWTLARSDARELIAPQVLDLGKQFSGSNADALLPLRVRGPGGRLECRSAPPSNGNGSSDLSSAMKIVSAPATIPSRENVTIKLNLKIPEGFAPGIYSGIIDLLLAGEGSAPEIHAHVPWHIRVVAPELTSQTIDLGNVAPGATTNRSVPLATRGGTMTVLSIRLQDPILRQRSPLPRQNAPKIALRATPKTPLILTASQSVANLVFSIAPDAPAGTICRELAFLNGGRIVGRMSVRANVLPQWLEVDGNLAFGRLEPGDEAKTSVTWKRTGASTGVPARIRAYASPDNLASCAVEIARKRANEIAMRVAVAPAAPPGPLQGSLSLKSGAAATLKRWTAEVIRPKIQLSREELDFGPIYPGQSRKLSLSVALSGVHPTRITAAIEAPPAKPLIGRIRLPQGTLRVQPAETTLQADKEVEFTAELQVPNSSQDGVYKTKLVVETRLGRMVVPVTFQVLSPIPLPLFHVSPTEIVLNVVDHNAGKPVTLTVMSQSDVPLPVRVHCQQLSESGRTSAELLRDGIPTPELAFILPERGETQFQVHPLSDAEDGDQCQIVIESADERQIVRATIVHSRRVSAVPKPRVEGIDWLTLLLIIPLLVAAFYVKQMVKRRWIRALAYSGLFHFALLFFIVMPATRQDSIPAGESSTVIDLDLVAGDGPLEDAASGGSGGRDVAGAAGPRGGDGLAALGGGGAGNGGALDGLKGGDQAPGGPTAAAALQNAEASGGELVKPAFTEAALARATGSNPAGADQALAADEVGDALAPEEAKIESAPATAPAGLSTNSAPAAAHVALPDSNVRVEVASGPRSLGVHEAGTMSTARHEAAGGSSESKSVTVAPPGSARASGEALTTGDDALDAGAVPNDGGGTTQETKAFGVAGSGRSDAETAVSGGPVSGGRDGALPRGKGGVAALGSGSGKGLQGEGGSGIGLRAGLGRGASPGKSGPGGTGSGGSGLSGTGGDGSGGVGTLGHGLGSSRGSGTGSGSGAGNGRGDAALDLGGTGLGTGSGTGRGNGSGPGVGNDGMGTGEGGPPGPRGNGPLATGGIGNGRGTGGGGVALAGTGAGMGDGEGPAAIHGAGRGTGGLGPGGKGIGGKATIGAALDGTTLDRAGRTGGVGTGREGTRTSDRPHWGPPTGAILRVTLGLAKHSADWNSSPTALFHLATAFRERCGLPDAEAEVSTVALNDPKAMAACRFLLFTANNPIVFTDAEIAALREYAENGGTIWFNDSGAESDERFDSAIRKDFERLFPGRKVEKLEMTHPLFHAAYDLTHGYKGYLIPPGDKYRQEFMEGVTLTGRNGKSRTVLIYTRNDYADGLEIDPRNIAGMPSLTDLSADEMLEGSLRFGINLVAYSLGSDAPQMPPPPESAAQVEKTYRYHGPPLEIFDAFDGKAEGQTVWQVDDWANPTQAAIVANPEGGHALKLDFKGGDKMKAAVGRNLELDLSAAKSVVVDIYSSLPHGFNAALLFQTKPDWFGFESRPIFIRPGWNRNLRFPLELDDFKTAKNDWKTYDQPFRPRNTVGQLHILLYNLGVAGEARIESIRIEK